MQVSYNASATKLEWISDIREACDCSADHAEMLFYAAKASKLIDVEDMLVEHVPPHLNPLATRAFPAHQKGPMIEEYFADYIKRNPVRCDKYTYLPIMWTENRRTKRFDRTDIIMYLKSLKRNGKKYITVCQHDDGVRLDDIHDLPEIKVFSAGGVGDVAIPLLSDIPNVKRVTNPKYKACFVGTPTTHQIRWRVFDTCHNIPNWIFTKGDHGTFLDVCSNSVFALCPRGFGAATFRLYEVMHMGCIPVYISDRFWLPFEDKIDWPSVAILIKENEIDRIEEKINYYSDRWVKEYQKRIAKVCEEYFTLEKCSKEIVRIIESVI